MANYGYPAWMQPEQRVTDADIVEALRRRRLAEFMAGQTPAGGLQMQDAMPAERYNRTMAHNMQYGLPNLWFAPRAEAPVTVPTAPAPAPQPSADSYAWLRQLPANSPGLQMPNPVLAQQGMPAQTGPPAGALPARTPVPAPPPGIVAGAVRGPTAATQPVPQPPKPAPEPLRRPPLTMETNPDLPDNTHLGGRSSSRIGAGQPRVGAHPDLYPQGTEIIPPLTAATNPDLPAPSPTFPARPAPPNPDLPGSGGGFPGIVPRTAPPNPDVHPDLLPNVETLGDPYGTNARFAAQAEAAQARAAARVQASGAAQAAPPPVQQQAPPTYKGPKVVGNYKPPPVEGPPAPPIKLPGMPGTGTNIPTGPLVNPYFGTPPAAGWTAPLKQPGFYGNLAGSAGVSAGVAATGIPESMATNLAWRRLNDPTAYNDLDSAMQDVNYLRDQAQWRQTFWGGSWNPFHPISSIKERFRYNAEPGIGEQFADAFIPGGNPNRLPTAVESELDRLEASWRQRFPAQPFTYQVPPRSPEEEAQDNAGRDYVQFNLGQQPTQMMPSSPSYSFGQGGPPMTDTESVIDLQLSQGNPKVVPWNIAPGDTPEQIAAAEQGYQQFMRQQPRPATPEEIARYDMEVQAALNRGENQYLNSPQGRRDQVQLDLAQKNTQAISGGRRAQLASLTAPIAAPTAQAAPRPQTVQPVSTQPPAWMAQSAASYNPQRKVLTVPNRQDPAYQAYVEAARANPEVPMALSMPKQTGVPKAPEWTEKQQQTYDKRKARGAQQSATVALRRGGMPAYIASLERTGSIGPQGLSNAQAMPLGIDRAGQEMARDAELAKAVSQLVIASAMSGKPVMTPEQVAELFGTMRGAAPQGGLSLQIPRNPSGQVDKQVAMDWAMNQNLDDPATLQLVKRRLEQAGVTRGDLVGQTSGITYGIGPVARQIAREKDQKARKLLGI